MTRLGLALGAGGARGLAHVGVLAALQRAGVRPDVVAGTSMGAIVGALWAETGDAAEVARRLDSYTGDPQFVSTWRPFLPGDDNQIAHGAHAMLGELHRYVQRKVVGFRTLTSPAQQPAERLLDPLHRLFRTKLLEDLPIPFAAVSADLRSGELVTFTSGDLVRAIYASSAIPGVFPPLHEGGALLVDGGGPARIPIRACRRLGADFVLAVDIPSFQTDDAEYRTGFDVILRADAITRQRLAERVLHEADFVVTPDVDEFHWAAFGRAPLIRAAGEAAMDAALEDLRAAVARRDGAGSRIRRAVESWWTDLVSGDEPSPR